MKEKIKGPLNVGVHAFIREKQLTARLLIQKKPLRFSWADNYLSKVEVMPTLLHLDDITDWRRRYPYRVKVNNRDYVSSSNWERAIQSVQWRFDLLTKDLGITTDFRKAFLKNEPRITFTEVHELLKKAGVDLEP